MKTEELLRGVKISMVKNYRDADIEHICFDSRECREGSLFVALKGSVSDGHNYIDKVLSAGAAVVVCEHFDFDETLYKDTTVILTYDSHFALGAIASNFYSNP